MDAMLDRSTGGAVLSPDVIDRAPRRIGGRDKVAGRLRYAGDLGAAQVGVDAVDTAVAIVSTQAAGRVLSVDDADALALPGVRLLMTHENAPRLKEVMSITAAEIGDLLPLQDDVLHYGGQCIGVLVADTLENARPAVHSAARPRRPPLP